jgi:hypothetical protein
LGSLGKNLRHGELNCLHQIEVEDAMSGFDVILLIGTVFALIGVWQTNKSNAIFAEQNRVDREADEANAGN